MKELLGQITIAVKAVFTEWFPSFLKMELGIIGEFLEALGYAKAIIAAIIGVVGVTVRWIWKKLNG